MYKLKSFFQYLSPLYNSDWSETLCMAALLGCGAPQGYTYYTAQLMMEMISKNDRSEPFLARPGCKQGYVLVLTHL